jgi:transcriptional regulator with XRE-family HTH domain
VAYSLSRRRPGRRETERKRFASLIKAVERIRIRDGMTNAELARGIGTGANVVSGWLNGRAIGREESVQRLKAFLNSYTASKQR